MPTPPDWPQDASGDRTHVGPVDDTAPTLVPPDAEFPRTLLPEPAGAGQVAPTQWSGDGGGDTSPTSGPAAYDLVGELGRGAMGVVYLARHRKLGRLVALKMVLGGGYAGAEDLARFQTEATAIARLAHPGIVAIYDVGDHNGLPYFAMEYCAGGSLASHLDGSPLAAEQAARLLVPIVRAMQHAHEQGVIHRDLKPGNVLLQVTERDLSGARRASKRPGGSPPASDGGAPGVAFSLREAAARPQLKVADFGLARLIEGSSQTQSGDLLGTPSYMAPEQAAGQVREIGPHTDVWALGAILYETLTGRPPFLGASSMDTVHQVLNREPVPVRSLQPQVPIDLETICHKCLQKGPARRYQSAGELADDLERYLEGRPILARPVGLVERARRWARRRPGMAALAGLLAASLLAGVGGVTAAMLYAFAGWDEAARLARSEKERAEEARQNFDLAERRYVQALGYIDRYFVEVSESTLLDEPDAQPLRQSLLRNAREFYTQFVSQRGDDPALQRELVRSQYRLGLIEAELGALPGAVRLFDDALARLGQRPADRGLRRDEALLLHHRGRVLRGLDRLDEATESYGRALALWRALRQADPDSLADKEGEAGTLMGLGNVDYQRKQFDEAARRYCESLALRQELVQADPKSEAYLRGLATNWENLAGASLHAGRAAEAERASGEARKALEALASAYPGRASYKDGLGMSHYNRAGRLLSAGNARGAIEAYLAALGPYTALALTHPSVPRYQERLAATYWNLGVAYDREGLADHARAAYQSEHQLNEKLAREHPGVPAHARSLARSLWKVGDLALGQGKLDEARADYERARGLLTGPGGKPPADRALLAEVTHQLGVVELRRARLTEAAGHFHQALKVLQGGGAELGGADRVLIARCYNSLGQAANRGGKHDDALKWYARATEAAQGLAGEKALRGEVAEVAYLADSGRALALDGLGRYDDAVKAWDAALKREAGGGLALMKARRLASLARTPRYAEAAAGAGAAGKGEGAGAVLVELARGLARAARTARQDESLAAGDRTKREEAYLGAAVALLRRAHEKGAFATPEGRQRLADDPDLAPLRERAEVKGWLGAKVGR